MRTIISRWFMFGLLLGWALTHATVFGQSTGKTAAEKVRQDLDKNITVDFTGQTLPEVLNHLKDKTGVTINIDQAVLASMPMNANVGAPGDPVQVKVKATNEKASQVLRKLLNAHYLSYVVLDDAVLVTSDEMATARQFLQRVSVSVEEVPLKKAVRDLAKSHGINLVIDPKMLKKADTLISVQLDNTSLETAIRLLAELADLKAARMGNVMYITSEEKAKKIREEERDQFDNPLNPSPSGVPQILGGPPPAVGPGVRGIVLPGNPLAAPPFRPQLEPLDPPTPAAPPQKPIDKQEPAPGTPPSTPPPGTIERPALPPAPALAPRKS